MNWNSFTFPGKIALAAAAVSVLYCGDTYRNVKDVSLEKKANIKIGKFYRQSLTHDGKRQWEILGEETYIFQSKKKQSRIIAYNFNFKQYDEKNKLSTEITAIRGEIDYSVKKLYLTGDGVFTSGSGRTIKSEKMTYNYEEKIMRSNAPVDILERGLYTHCRLGIIVERTKERQVCKGVSGVHSRRPSEGGAGDSIFQ